MARTATQREVAAAAGVSPTTVSFVLAGREREMKISPACAERIRAAARKMDYRGNRHAKALATGKSGTLGLVSPGPAISHRHLFSQRLTAGVERRARERGHDLLFFGHRGDQSELTHAMSGLVDKRVDALLLPFFPASHLVRDRARRWPLVLLLTKAGNGYPSVSLDAEAGIRQAVEHLAGLGHRRVLRIGTRQGGAVQLPHREAAFLDAARCHGMIPETRHVPIAHDPSSEVETHLAAYRQSLSALDLPRDATAVLCHNDTMALALLNLCAERGLRVPRDLSVVGFDDLLAGFAFPPLTTVSHMLPEIGAQAVDLALDLLDNDRPYPCEREIRVAAQLVVRQSTGPAPGRRT
jgi:DNA-binding LacI/PurR family transcriptional regulator